MTIHEAVAKLIDAKPGVSFKIECEVWSHVHLDGRRPLDIGWRIWDANRRESVTGPTLDTAVAAAIVRPSLDEVQAAVEPTYAGVSRSPHDPAKVTEPLL